MPWPVKTDVPEPPVGTEYANTMDRLFGVPVNAQHDPRDAEIASMQRRIEALEAQVSRLMQWQLEDLTKRRGVK